MIAAKSSDNELAAQLSDWLASQRAHATNRELADLYAISVMSYRAANFWADNGAAVPMRPHDPQGNPLDPKSTHPLARIFYAPDWSETMSRTILTDLFWGRNLLHRERNIAGVCINLRWVSPVVYRLDAWYGDGLRGFYVYPGRYHVEPVDYIPLADAVYFHRFDFDDDYDGIAPAEAVFLQASTEPELALTVLAYFRNMAVPGAIIQPATDKPDKRYEDDRTPLEKFLKRVAQGARNAGRTIVMATRWDWLQLQPVFKDIMLREQRQDVQEQIAEGFDVSIEFFTTGQTTYAELEGKIALWRENKLIPRMKWYAARFTSQLQDEYPGYTIVPDFKDILREDEAAKVSTVNAKVQGVTLNLYDAQKELGYTPDANLQGLYLIQGVPVPSSALPTYWERTLGASAAAILPPGESPAAALALDTDKQTETAAPPAPSTGEPLCIAIDLGTQPDLLALQSRLKALYPSGVKWNTPDNFHITLVYAPTATEAQIAALIQAVAALDVSALRLGVGSLRAMDNLGEHALHFRVRKNAALIELQEDIHDLLEAAGIPMSQFSDPTAYTPHITMGYSDSRIAPVTFQSGLTLAPAGIIVWYGDRTLYKSAAVPAVENAPDKPAEKRVPGSAKAELRAWRSTALKRGADAAKAWTPVHVDAVTAAYVLLALDDAESVSAAFDGALSLKSFSQTWGDFVAEVASIIGKVWADESTRGQYAGALRSALRRYGLLAFRDGMNAEGYNPESFSKSELDAFRRWQEEASSYVTKAGAELFKGGGITEGEIAIRAEMWGNKSLRDIYLKGQLLAAPKKPKMWRRDAKKESCSDCIRLDGKVRSLEDWNKTILPGDSRLECRGYLCGCDLVDPPAGKKAEWDWLGDDDLFALMERLDHGHDAGAGAVDGDEQPAAVGLRDPADGDAGGDDI
jgi:2'-5' RNA ligase